MFSKDSEEFSTVDGIINFIKYVSKMLVASCVTEGQNALFELCVLDFLDLVSDLPSIFVFLNIGKL